MRPSIAFVNPSIFPAKHSTGITNFTPRTALGKIGIDVRIYARAYSLNQKKADYVSLYKSRMRQNMKDGIPHFIMNQLDMLLFAFFCVRKIRQERVSAVIIQHLWYHGNLIPMLLISTIRPTFVWRQGGSLRLIRNINWPLYWFTLITHKAASRNVVFLTENDPEQLDNIRRLLQVPSERVRVLGIEPVDGSIFYPRPRTVSPADKTTILCIGRIERRAHVSEYRGYEKDPFMILDIFFRVSETRNDVELWFAGDGAGLSELKELVLKNGRCDRVKFLGHLSSESLAEHICAATLTFTPHPMNSLFEDSVSIRESLACGAPAAAFKRYPRAKSEYPGGFLIPYETEGGFRELIARLSPEYLDGKRNETSYAFSLGNYTFAQWAANAKAILESCKPNFVQ